MRGEGADRAECDPEVRGKGPDLVAQQPEVRGEGADLVAQEPEVRGEGADFVGWGPGFGWEVGISSGEIATVMSIGGLWRVSRFFAG